MNLIRNTIRAFYIYLFSVWSSCPIWSPKIFREFFEKSVESYKEKSGYYLEARDNGLFYFSMLPLNYSEKIQKDVDSLYQQLKKSHLKLSTFTVWILKQPISPTGEWYSAVDEVYLLALYIWSRKLGTTPPQAIHWAHKWLPFQYFRPPILQIMRGNNMGEVLSILWFSTARFLETHITRPWVFVLTLLTPLIFLFVLIISIPKLFCSK
jgi:hypothetical protein